MQNELPPIDTLEELEAFLVALENGSFGLQGVAGVGMATSNKDGRHFVAVFGDNHALLLTRWVTDEIFETGKDMVQNGPKRH